MINSQKLMSYLFIGMTSIMAITFVKSINDFSYNVIVESRNKEEAVALAESEINETSAKTETEKTDMLKYTSVSIDDMAAGAGRIDLLNDLKDYELKQDEKLTVFTITDVGNNEDGKLQINDERKLVIGPHTNSSKEQNVVKAEYALATEEAKDIQEQIKQDEVTAYAVSSDKFSGSITRYSDLSNRIDITADEINLIIDYFVAGRDSALTDQGQAFIDAAQITGKDPIWLLSLAVNESGWEVTALHRKLNNLYSINMTDGNPSGGYRYDSIADGIINGAIWINENYYLKGQTNLYLMIYGKKCYSSSKDEWINKITKTMNKCYRVLENA